MTNFLAQIIYFLVRLLNLTYRYEFIGLENKKLSISTHPQKTYIYALWHQNLIGAIFSHIGERFTMPISESKDGELVAVTCKKFGHLPARGSSHRGGKKAMISLIQNIRDGIPGAISVDGPTGPAHLVKPGIVEIARHCQCDILPLSPYPVSYWEIKKSWDCFRIPKPFSKIIIIIGKPIKVSFDISPENFDLTLLTIKNHLEQGEELAKSMT